MGAFRCGIAVVLILFGVVGPSSIQSQDVDSAGNRIGFVAPAEGSAPRGVEPPCSVLSFGGGADNGTSRFGSLGYAATTTGQVGDLTRANLQSYDVLNLDQAPTSTYSTQISEIRDWVQLDGGGLMVTQPNVVEAVAVFPAGFEAQVTSILWPGFPSAPASDIIDNSHPITQGLADNDVSGPFDTVPLANLGASWSVLAVEASLDTSLALAVGTFGTGRLVLNAANFSSGSLKPGTDTYVDQLVSWACAGGGAGPTATPTPTPPLTPTPTRTPTLTPVPGAVDAPEVPTLSGVSLVVLVLLLGGAGLLIVLRSRF